MNEKVKVTFTELTSQRHAEVVLSTILTGKDLIEKLRNAKFLAELQRGETYILHHKRSGNEIGPDTSLAQVGIQQNDVITVGVDTRGG